jgi:hypothetical protein
MELEYILNHIQLNQYIMSVQLVEELEENVCIAVELALLWKLSMMTVALNAQDVTKLEKSLLEKTIHISITLWVYRVLQLQGHKQST